MGYGGEVLGIVFWRWLVGGDGLEGEGGEQTVGVMAEVLQRLLELGLDLVESFDRLLSIFC